MNVPQNKLKQKLKEDRPQLGIFHGLPTSYAAEICAGAGFDWVLIDAEHSPFDLPLILQQVQAMAAFDIPIIVRPAEGDKIRLKKLLDIGVQSFLIPMVESKEQAEHIVAATRYPPKGIRGVGSGLSRAAQWDRVGNYFEEAEKELCLILQIESVKGVQNLEAIASIPEVDALFVGPADLAASMGYIGQSDHPEVVDTITRCISLIQKFGKAVGVFALDKKMIELYAPMGGKPDCGRGRFNDSSSGYFPTGPGLQSTN